MSSDTQIRPEPAAPEPSERSRDAVCTDACVVIPMFNEASVIVDVVSRVRQVFEHIVCVDDGSDDDCAALAAAAGATVVRHPFNLGQGAALQTGIEFALRDNRPVSFLVTFDADGQHRVQDALAMVDYARESHIDVVLGSRFLGQPTGVPLGRRLLLRAAVAFSRLTTGLALTDAHNGLRVLTRPAARILDLRLTGMAHASEILNVIARERLSYVEMPIQVLYTNYSRAKGQSSINAFNIVFDLTTSRIRPATR